MKAHLVLAIWMGGVGVLLLVALKLFSKLELDRDLTEYGDRCDVTLDEKGSINGVYPQEAGHARMGRE
jgi:hypothetical protein